MIRLVDIEIEDFDIEEVPDYFRILIEQTIEKIEHDKIYKTNRGFYIFEDNNLKRIYIYKNWTSEEEYTGLMLDEIEFLIETFKIQDPRIFLYPYDYEEEVLCIGKPLEGEEIL